MNSRYTNRDNDPRGVWKAADMTVKSYSSAYDYPITTPSGKVVKPAAGRCWNTSKENFEEYISSLNLKNDISVVLEIDRGKLVLYDSPC